MDVKDFMDIENELIVVDSISTELAEYTPPNDTEVDYQQVRSNIYDLLEKGNEGLDIALDIVKSTESPRAIEVLSTLLKTLTDTNLQLLDLQRKRQDLTTPSENGTTQKIGTLNQTAIFTGTTAELATLLQDMQNK